MKFGLSVGSIDKLLSVFMSFSEIEKAIVFGSRSTGGHKEGSDIDIALVGKIDFALFLKIKVELSNLNLPYEIDLHNYSRIENPELIKSVDSAGTVLYERSNGRSNDIGRV